MSFDFYSLVNSIKEKSSQAMETLGADLKEFTTVVQEDVAEVARSVRTNRKDSSNEGHEANTEQTTEEDDGGLDQTPDAQEVSKQKIPLDQSVFRFGASLLQRADKFLDSLNMDQSPTDSAATDQVDDKLSTDRLRLLALQEDPETYLVIPLDVETFCRWKEQLTADELAALKEEVVSHYPAVSDRLSQLVPGEVSEEDFWFNYLYKASLLAAQEKRGAELFNQGLDESDEEEIGWDVDSPTHTNAATASQVFAASEGGAKPIVLPLVESDTEKIAGSECECSDGSEWVELEERKSTTPPTSEAMKDSPHALTDSHPISASESKNGDDDDEDLDWGDGGLESGFEQAVKTHEEPNTARASKKTDEDWGEWS